MFEWGQILRIFSIMMCLIIFWVLNMLLLSTVRQGVTKWTFSMLLRVLVSQNRDRLHNDRVSVPFSDEDVNGHCNKKLNIYKHL